MSIDGTKRITGFSIIELIVAVSIFVIIASGGVIAVVSGLTTERLSEEETNAALMAEEGFEAAKSIRNQGWNGLTNGPHGLTNTGGVWAFSGTSDAIPPYTRNVTVSDVYRNGGNIVTTGGTLDPDTKKVTSTVSWGYTATRLNSVELVSYLTNWLAGSSTGTSTPSCTTHGDCLVVNTGAAAFSSNHRQILNITLGNNDPVNTISITKMRVTWTGNTGRRMNTIRINNTTVWTGNVASGVQVSILTTFLPVGTTAMPINYIQFNGDMSGSVFTIEFTMDDNTTKTITGITPI